MAVTFQTFLREYPEFQKTDLQLVQNTINQIKCETCNYSGYCDETLQDCLVSLHVAHILTVTNRTTGKASQGYAVKKMKTKQDEIEYQTNNTDPFDFSQTTYGMRLRKALDLNYLPFLLC